jgi:succinate-semialdehyde dehydrogenase / glutarate-semialdehyde dehydrogenase
MSKTPRLLIATNPTTGTVVSETPTLDAAQLERVMAQSVAAFPSWQARAFSERAELLLAVAKHMRENVETLAPIMTAEMGKPIKEARAEVNKAALCAEHYAHHAQSYLAAESINSDAQHSYVQYQPLGAVLGILPWNAPFWLAFRFCAPALMAGNTCLMKHDPHVSGCAAAIVAAFDAAGAPPGVMQNLPLANEQIESVIRDRRVQALSFTGSSAAGAKVASVAASEIKSAVLELGGSDPCIILADADLAAAVKTVTVSRIINAGQSCIAAKRIIVEAPVYDKFVGMLQASLAALKVGDPAEDATDVGPIARADLRQLLHRQVQDSISQGARCLLGGELPEGRGYFYPVTLLADVTNDMAAGCEETFGPVAVVMKADNDEHALQIANDSEFGLAGSVWTSSSRGEALALRMEVGQVSVNGIVKTDPRLPSGGIKRSGYGRELGPHGIKEFVNAKQIWLGPSG